MIDLSKVLGEEQLGQRKYNIGHSIESSKDGIILHNPKFDLIDLTESWVYLFTEEQVMSLAQKTLEKAVSFYLRTQIDPSGSFIDMNKKYYELLRSLGIDKVYILGRGYMTRLWLDEYKKKGI
ncbi:MAG: hypothetical protein V1663_01775 [archaeon]